MIDLSEKTVGIWYLQMEDTVDWLGCITEVWPEEEYRLEYRFRYYRDNNVFEHSADEKHWFAYKAKGTKKEVLDNFRALITSFSIMSQYPEKFYEILNHGDFQDFIKRFKAAPFAHSREATPEETQQFLLDKQREIN